MAVDDDPAALAAVARDERGFILAGPDVRARSIKRVTSTGGRGFQAGGLPEKIAAAAVHLTSDDADYIHAAALHIDGGRVGASDRHALSGTRTGLLWRNHIGRFVGSVIAASGNSLLATISVRRKLVFARIGICAEIAHDDLLASQQDGARRIRERNLRHLRQDVSDQGFALFASSRHRGEFLAALPDVEATRWEEGVLRRRLFRASALAT